MLFVFTVDCVAGVSRLRRRSTRRAVRRSQTTYEVEVFDQILALNETYRTRGETSRFRLVMPVAAARIELRLEHPVL